MEKKGYSIGNIDATVTAQKPKLSGYIQDMRKIIASACKTDIENINIKATTEEKLGFTGECLGISAHSVCLLEKIEDFPCQYKKIKALMHKTSVP